MKDRIGSDRKKGLKLGVYIIIFAIILLFASTVGINAFMKSSVKDRIVTAEEAAAIDADCILVLGAGVWEGNRPSYLLEDRLLRGIELYENGVSDRLLTSGDHGTKGYDEVNVMKSYAIEKGVPSEHIFMDHAGFATYDSMYRAKDVFMADKVIIVTQEYHLYRALYIGEKLGLESYGVTSDLRPYANQWYMDIREVLARVKDFFKAIIKPEPAYLGESMPVSGDGDMTNDW
ncbi:MAG: DUF218 domain-containing protein [Clostridiales bacterium]|nr:DUF218 domain-containing protein [Clostridiales bacterium]